MGAGNISIIAVLPARIPKRTWDRAKKRLDQIRKVMADIERISPTVCQADSEGKRHSQASFYQMLANMQENKGLKIPRVVVGPLLTAYESARSDNEDLKGPSEELLTGLEDFHHLRDTSTTTITLYGHRLDVLVAVTETQRSSGEEPMGVGYQTLKAAFRWGFIDLLGDQ